jgi:hypothetical protein
MPPQTLERRVERLERRVTILEQLPARVDGLAVQISQLREEMRAEFSAVRNEIVVGDERVITTLREEIRAGDVRVITTLREEIRAGDVRVSTTLREEIGAVMTQSRVLYEDLKASLALIQESLSRPLPRRPGRRNR